MDKKNIEKKVTHTYILSIREASAEALLEGSKPHEFRKRFDNYKNYARVFLYVTRPVKKIVGQVIFDAPIHAEVNELYKLLEHNKFDDELSLSKYFSRYAKAYALPVIEAKRFNDPINLKYLKNRFPSFNPPMSYSKIDDPSLRELKVFLSASP